MKMTVAMLEKMGVTNKGTQNKLMEIFDEMDTQMEEMKAALEGKDSELAENRKIAAIEREILAAGGRNVKAILALIDTEEVSFDGKKLQGLDLNAVKAEAPYLFHEKENRTKGTGMTKGYTRKENEISAAFRKGLRR